MTQRYVVTRPGFYNAQAPHLSIPERGHWIGPGRPSVLTLHKRIRQDMIRQELRRLKGRYAWRRSTLPLRFSSLSVS